MIRGGRRFLLLILISVLFAALGSTAYSQSLTVAASPQTITIHPGDENIPITVSVASANYSGPVNITLTGLPSGISFAPLVVNPGSTGTLELSASVSADQEAFPADAPYDANTDTETIQVTAIAGTVIATAPISLTVSLTNPSFAPAGNAINLPIVTINTDGVPIIDKGTDVPGTITITSANGSTSYLPNSSDTDDTATFQVHGNTTAQMPKLAYEIKLNTSLDLLNTMGLVCPYVTSGKAGKPTCDKSKTYVLLANYDDKTFLRDWSASALANAIPIGGAYLNSPADSPTPSGTSTLMPWAPHSLFVELYLNGQYEGNYQLIEKVNVDSHRINITELTDTQTSGDLTGGYQVEIDQRQGEDYNWITPEGVYLGLNDPDFTPEVPEQTSYITNYTDTAEDALFSSNFTDPTLGWRAYFDEASAINFYIVNDLMDNSDGGRFYSSDYFYKNVDNALIYMGPIWDFDISSGNVNYNASVTPDNPWMQTQAIWYKQWFQDPGFVADVETQWNALKNNGVLSTWLNSIATESATLEQSQANNFGRWPMQGIKVWPNPEAAGTYNEEVSYLLDFLNMRLGYLDTLFNSKASSTVTLAPPSGTLRQGSPVTLTATVTGGNSPTGTVTFLGSYSLSTSNLVVLGASPLNDGQASLTVSNLPTGSGVIVQAVYNGDNNNALTSSNALSLTVLPAFLTSSTALTSAVSTSENPPTLTAVVTGTSGTVQPTGSVDFYNGAALLGAETLANGVAVYTPSSSVTPGATLQAVYLGDSNFDGSWSNVLTATGQTSQTITFGALANQVYGAAPFTVSASASSGLSVSFASATFDTCSVSGTTVTLVGGGVCTIVASQAGDTSYLPATPVAQSFSINGPQTINFPAPGLQAPGNGPVPMNATASSGLPVTLTSNSPSICSVSGESAILLASGTCSITASQAGVANLVLPAAPVTQTFLVAQNLLVNGGFENTLSPWLFLVTADGSVQASESLDTTTVHDGQSSLNVDITSSSPVDFHVDLEQDNLPLIANATYQVSFWAKSTSRQPIIWGVRGAAPNYTVYVPPVSAYITTEWAQYSFTFLAPETASDGRLQFFLGNDIGNVWLDDVQLYGIAGLAQSINFPAPGVQGLGSAPLVLNATANSGLPVTLTSNSSTVCAVSGGTVLLLTSGTCSITASQPGNALYPPATSVTQTFSVVPNLLQNGGFESTLSPWLFIVASDGEANATASLSTSTYYDGLSSVDVDVVHAAAEPWNIDLEQDNLSLNAGTTYQIQFWAKSDSTNTIQVAMQGGAPSYAIYSPTTAMSVTTSWALYSFTFTAPTTASDGRLEFRFGNAAGNVWIDDAQLFGIANLAQTIDFPAPGIQGLGSVPLVLNPTASSGLPVTLTSNNTPVCTVSGYAVTLLTAGTCSITATQSGNSVYPAAPPVTQTFPVVANLLQNGGFESSLTPWLFTVEGGAAATAGLSTTTVYDGTSSVNIDVTAATPSTTWYVLLEQDSISLTAGWTYQIAFWAKADSHRAIQVEVQGGGPSYAIYMPSTTVNITPTWTQYSLTFVAPITAADGRLEFHAASATGNVWLDDAQLFGIDALAQTISFAPISAQALGFEPPQLSATASSGLPVSFASNSMSVCTVTNNTLTFLGTGTCSITASQSGNSVYPAATPVTQTFTVGSNLLANGGFESSLTPWLFTVEGGAAATAGLSTTTVYDGTSSVNIDVTAATPSTTWYVLLEQDSISLTAGWTYQVVFWAKADSDRAIQVEVQGGGPSYAIYMPSTTVNITPTWTQYSLTFAAPTTVTNGRLEFHAASATGNVWLDDTALIVTAE